MSKASTQFSYKYIIKNRPFGFLWASQGVSTLGDVIYDVALLWYVLQSTGSALATSGIAIFATVGRLIGGFTASAVLDRLPARRIMLWADFARLVITLGFCILWLAGFTPTLPLLYVLAFVISLATGYFSPARDSAIPQVVPHDDILKANALDSISSSIVQTASFALSGILVAIVGPKLALLLDAGTFLISYLLVQQARWEPIEVNIQERSSPLAVILKGFRWTFADPLARVIVGAESLHALAAGFFTSALALFIKQIGGGPVLYGAQGGIFGVGLLLASYTVGRRSTKRVGLLYASGVIINSIGNTLFSLSPAPGWLLPTVFISGLGSPPWATGKQSLLQVYLPSHVRGRVFALLDTLTAATLAPSYVVGGWMADHLGARWVMMCASIFHICIGLYLLSLKRVRMATLDNNKI